MSFLGGNVVDLLYKEGEHPIRYLEPDGIRLEKETGKYCGFYFDIRDRKNNIYYSSFLDYRTQDTDDEYNNFKSKSLFRINKVTPVNVIIDEDFVVPALIVELSFNCKLYQHEVKNSSAVLSEGKMTVCLNRNGLIY